MILGSLGRTVYVLTSQDSWYWFSCRPYSQRAKLKRIWAAVLSRHCCVKSLVGFSNWPHGTPRAIRVLSPINETYFISHFNAHGYDDKEQVPIVARIESWVHKISPLFHRATGIHTDIRNSHLFLLRLT